MIFVEYISVKQAAEQWRISDRRVRVLCEEGKIDGVKNKAEPISFRQM